MKMPGTKTMRTVLVPGTIVSSMTDVGQVVKKAKDMPATVLIG